MPADYYIMVDESYDAEKVRKELERLGGDISNVSSRTREKYGLGEGFIFRMHFSGRNVDDVYAYGTALRQVSGVRDVRMVASGLEKGWT